VKEDGDEVKVRRVGVKHPGAQRSGHTRLRKRWPTLSSFQFLANHRLCSGAAVLFLAANANGANHAWLSYSLAQATSRRW
jgi:hypothetical protein